MISFSYRSFREHLKSNLEKDEAKFLARTFGFSSLYFFGFGLLLCAVYSIVKSLGWGGQWAFSGIASFLGLCLWFLLSFFSIKYSNNPLRMPNTFVTSIFCLLTSVFLFLFLGVLGLLEKLIGVSLVYASVGIIFGVSFLIYLLPCSAALIIMNRNTIIALNKFLNGCYCFFIGIWIISLLIGFLGLGISGFWLSFLFVLVTLMLLLSPVITIYRMKTVAYYINYDDSLERKKWERYFIFEILYQLLQLALFVTRTALMFLSGRFGSSRTRL